MSRPVVVDSSVAVKWFKPEGESGFAEALDLLREHRAEELYLTAPTLLRLEVLNALRSHGASAAQLGTASTDLEGFRLRWYEVTAERATAAAGIAAASGLTVYDAIFVALAVELDTELVTADRVLAQRSSCATRTLGLNAP